MPIPEMNPEIVGKGVTLKTAISSRRQGFTSGAHTISVADTPERLNDISLSNASRLIPVHRHSDINVGFLAIDYGVMQVPVDGTIIFMLVIHPDTLTLTGDDLEHFIDQSFWNAVQHWQNVTAVGIVQTLSREQVFIGEDAIFTDAFLKQDSYHIGLLVASDATQTVRVDGVVNWTETLYQRRWPSRNSSEWSGWNAGMDGENYGQFGS